MNNRSELCPTQNSLLGVKRMIAIDAGQELHPVSHSRMIRTITIRAEIGAHLPEAWEIMQ